MLCDLWHDRPICFVQNLLAQHLSFLVVFGCSARWNGSIGTEIIGASRIARLFFQGVGLEQVAHMLVVSVISKLGKKLVMHTW